MDSAIPAMPVTITDMTRSVALGWQLLQLGNLTGAEEAIKPWLHEHVGDALVPLVGTIRLQQGRYSEAAPLLERARALLPNQPRFAFLHGAALAGMQDYNKAIEAYETALKLDPNFADTYLALGAVQRKLGQLQQAQNTFRQLLRIKPDNVDGYVALGSTFAQAGQFEEAETPLRRALDHSRDPKTQAIIWNNLSIALSSQNRNAEALDCLDRTQALAPQLPNLDQRRINILFQLGRFEECLSQYRALLERNPSDPNCHKAYNSLLHRLGRKDEFLNSYDLAPQTREILLGKASMLALQKRGEEAAEIYNRLLTRDPLDTAAAAGWANTQMLLGKHAESMHAFELLINRGNNNPELFSSAAGAALLAGDPQKGEYFCQLGIRQNRFDQTCLALLGTAWRMQDDERDEILNNYEGFIRVFDLDPPDGYSSMDAFNAELGAYLEQMHPRTDAYLEQSLQGGSQTEGHLFGSGHVLVEKLRARIEEILARYIADLGTRDDHPFMARRRKSFQFAGAWSCLMRGQGFHTNHLHPAGWISSCYYVTVPAETKDTDTRNGWIKFGEPSLDITLKNAIRRAVVPSPGRLVLFPSYMWHGTIPLKASSARTTIAFDVTPL